MEHLTTEQKSLIFDYCIGITDEKQSAVAEEIIFSNPEAATLARQIKKSLSPLETYKVESCPEYLAQQTIEKISELAHSNQRGLEQLLATEQIKEKTRPTTIFLRNLTQLATAAAIILILISAYFPPMRYARQKSWESQCRAQLSRVGRGLANYRTEHDDLMPAVARADGQPWWKVGYQGEENQSNTRNIWLLAKKGYVETTDFVCPGKRQGQVLKFDTANAKYYNDFPNRNYVTYSFRLISCDKNARPKNITGRKVLMSDLNPLFERLPSDFSSSFKLKLNEKLLKLNSANHNRRGQNLLFCDGAVKFNKKRTEDITADDIFTLQDTPVYEGTELPKSETDAFLAP